MHYNKITSTFDVALVPVKKTRDYNLMKENFKKFVQR